MMRFDGFERLNGFARSAALVMVLAAVGGGCMRIPRAPVTPPHWAGSPAPGGDPFLNSPPSTPQGQPTPAPADVAPTPDDGPQPTFGDSYSAPLPVESQRVPTPTDLPPVESYSPGPSVNPNVEPPRLEAPTIVPQEVTVPPTLKLAVNAPENKLVGEVTVFEVTLQNTGDDPAEDVVIESRFEEGFVFPGSTDRQVNQTIGTLDAGESRDLKLSLRSDREGHHCVEFSLLAKGAKTVTEKVCVQYRDSAVSLEINGPARRMVGGHAEWNLTLLSRNDRSVADASVVLEYDSTYLKPIGGSEGARQELGRITWPLGKLAAAERVELQIEFECLMPVDSTCLSLEVTAEDQTEQTAESCLAIDRPTGALEIDLGDSPDPVQIGAELQYQVTVTNRDLQAVHELQVTATLPEMFRGVSFEVREGGQVLSGINAGVQGKVVKFDPVDVLAPDSKLTYRIKVKALQAGTGRLLLSVSSDDGPSGKIRLEEVSTVVKQVARDE